MVNHDSRARELLGKMKLNEKAAQMFALWVAIHEDGKISLRILKKAKSIKTNADPFTLMKDGIGQITRPLGTHILNAQAAVRGVNKIQKYLVEKTRLKIPALPHEECLVGLMGKGATLFPTGINYGAMWDEDLVNRIAKAIGKELYSVGSRQGLSPVLDVVRDARWGRTEETMGEDPYLTGCLSVEYVKGLQGPDRKILATLKHYAGHSLSEGGRNHAPVRIGERELNDVFLLPFEMAVKLANAGSVMPAYHDIDGEPLHASKKYINDLLRDEWGFDGIVVSDYVGINYLSTEHRVAADYTEATALAVKAGVDMELPAYDCYGEGIKKAIDKGLLSVNDIDACVYRILKEKSRLGLFENPFTDEGPVILNSDESRKLAKEAALKSIILLKNDGILPLKNIRKMALIGPLADDPLCFFGGYSFPVHLVLSGLDHDHPPARTIKEVFEERFDGKILYSKGCDILTERPTDSPTFPGEVGAQGDVQKSYISYDKSGFKDAVKKAKQSDCVVITLGDLAGLFLTGTVGEGSDVSSLKLPGIQQELLDEIIKTGKPVIVILINGRPYNIGKSTEKVSGLINALLPGQEGAEAMYDILSGKENPSAKLPVSVPKTAGAMPFFYNYKLKSAGTPIQAEFGAQFPFGFGMSYTEFKYDNFSIKKKIIPVDGEFEISCTVKNNGKMEGEDVVQLYIRDMVASIVQPIKELKGFKKIYLKPGEKKTVIFNMPADILSFTGYENKRIIEPGEFEIYLGNSSRDIYFRDSVFLTGEVRTLGKDWRMLTNVTVK